MLLSQRLFFLFVLTNATSTYTMEKLRTFVSHPTTQRITFSAGTIFAGHQLLKSGLPALSLTALSNSPHGQLLNAHDTTKIIIGAVCIGYGSYKLLQSSYTGLFG